MRTSGTLLSRRETQSKAQYVCLERRGGLLRATVVGPQVGQRHVPILAEEITAAIDSMGPALQVLLLDLHGVQMMTGMGLGLCVSLARQARCSGAKTVVRTRHDLAQLFRMLKLDKLCTIADDDSELETAIAA